MTTKNKEMKNNPLEREEKGRATKKKSKEELQGLKKIKQEYVRKRRGQIVEYHKNRFMTPHSDVNYSMKELTQEEREHIAPELMQYIQKKIESWGQIGRNLEEGLKNFENYKREVASSTKKSKDWSYEEYELTGLLKRDYEGWIHDGVDLNLKITWLEQAPQELIEDWFNRLDEAMSLESQYEVLKGGMSITRNRVDVAQAFVKRECIQSALQWLDKSPPKDAKEVDLFLWGGLSDIIRVVLNNSSVSSKDRSQKAVESLDHIKKWLIHHKISFEELSQCLSKKDNPYYNDSDFSWITHGWANENKAVGKGKSVLKTYPFIRKMMSDLEDWEDSTLISAKGGENSRLTLAILMPWIINFFESCVKPETFAENETVTKKAMQLFWSAWVDAGDLVVKEAIAEDERANKKKDAFDLLGENRFIKKINVILRMADHCIEKDPHCVELAREWLKGLILETELSLDWSSSPDKKQETIEEVKKGVNQWLTNHAALGLWENEKQEEENRIIKRL